MTTTQRILAIGGCALLCGLWGTAALQCQSTFPIHFDPEPLTNAMGVKTASATNVETGRNYRKSFTYEVSGPSTSVNVLDLIATADDTVVVIKVLVSATAPDAANSGSMKQNVIRAHWDADALGAGGQWTGIRNQGVFAYNTNGTISVSANVAGSGPLEIEVNPPPSFELMTVMLEVVANEDVTFAEFTDPT